MQKIEKEDMQGLIVRSYKKLQVARFMLLSIQDAPQAKKYLKSIIPQVTTAATSPDHFALQLAFTSPGLKKFGLPDAALASFPREFLEGMHDPLRAFLLGDQNANQPTHWNWGGPNNEEVHLIMLCYAKEESAIDEWMDSQKGIFQQQGISIIKEQKTQWLPDAREHFGFRDGISAPVAEGFRDSSEEPNPIKAGEFVLGYSNEYDQFTESPVVKALYDQHDLLPSSTEDPAFKDIGKNGTYVVYRQLAQYVYEFWKYLAANSKEPAPTPLAAAVKLGAKIIGRWPSGSPLVLSPDQSDPTLDNSNDFAYSKEDPDGMKCPFGAHIRRTNPRDKLFARSQEVSIEMIRKHQILRRGRSYGLPLVPSMEPQDVLASKDDGKERGLHFICLAGNLNRQFEFIQNAWVKGQTLAGLFKDADPILAARHVDGQPANDQFTCPASPVRRKYKDMPQFTRVMGGAYFFMPGIRSLQFIINC